MQEKPTADGKTKRQLVGLERRAIREVLFGEKVEVQKANPKERKDWQKKFCGQKKLKLCKRTCGGSGKRRNAKMGRTHGGSGKRRNAKKGHCIEKTEFFFATCHNDIQQAVRALFV